MRRKLMLSLALATSLLAKTELSLQVGTNSFDSSEYLEDTTSLGIRGDFYLDNLYHIDVGYTKIDDAKIKDSNQKAKVQRLYTQFSADGEEEYHVVPTLSVGIGREKVELPTDSGSETFLSLGIGFRYNVSNSFNFLLGTKAIWKTKSRNVNYNTTFGVGYLIDEEPVNNEEVVQEVVIPEKKLDISTEFKPTPPKPLPPVEVKVPDTKEISVASENIEVANKAIPQEIQSLPQPVAAPTIAPAPMKVSKRATVKSGYFVQVGAYTKNRPTAMLDRLASKGYHIILRHKGPLTKALVGPYKSESEARRALINIKRISPKAFLYKAN